MLVWAVNHQGTRVRVPSPLTPPPRRAGESRHLFYFILFYFNFLNFILTGKQAKRLTNLNSDFQHPIRCPTPQRRLVH